MSHFADLMNSAEDLLFGTFGGSSVTYAADATTVAITDAWKGDEVRVPGIGRALDTVNVPWRFRASQLTTVKPGPGNTVTEGSIEWTVDEGGATYYGQGEFVSVQTSRKVQRGQA